MNTVIVSGIHSDLNSASGAGIARSLRSAWPDLRVLKLDYSSRSKGPDLPGFNERYALPPIDQMDHKTIKDTLVRLADKEDALFISGVDLESRILADICPERMLVPPVEAFDLIRKENFIPLANALGIRAPFTHAIGDIPTAAAQAEAVGLRVSVKGPNFEPRRLAYASSLEDSLAELELSQDTQTWLQEDVDGVEISYCLSADRGMLLGACRMERSNTSPIRHTWDGTVRVCDERELSILQSFVELTSWTGGAELKIVLEHGTEIEYLIDLNPIFPDWIHGATLAGINLPASLVSLRLNRSVPAADQRSSSFTRIITEVAQLKAEDYSIGSLIEPKAAGGDLIRDEFETSRPSTHQQPPVEQPLPTLEYDLLQEDATPFRHFMPNILQTRLDMAMSTMKEVAKANTVPGIIAYSTKTNPRPEVLSVVRASGAGIECISRSEVNRALEAGFPPELIVLNGPGKWWPYSSTPLEVGYIFADSVEDFARILDQMEQGMLVAENVGIRVRPPLLDSRFGLDLTNLEEYETTVNLVRQIPRSIGFGMHFHTALSTVGTREWVANYQEALRLFASLCSDASTTPSIVDIGGGWPSQISQNDLRNVWDVAFNSALDSLGEDIKIVAEPGKLIVESSSALISRVLEVHRNAHGVKGIVVDAAVNLLPDWEAPTKRVIWRPQGSDQWVELPTGQAEILGRVCMEEDRLRRMVDFPSTIAEGDLVAFLGVGGYDDSMAYEFGA